MDETEKRIKISEDLTDEFKNRTTGIILAGSVAYSPYENVNKNSDIDLIIITNDLKRHIDRFITDISDRKSLKSRFFEGYCFKEQIDNVPVSFHLLSEDAFEVITKCFVADIRVFRPKSKDEKYVLYGFERNQYNYWIKNIGLKEFKTGVRTIVPVGFINNDRYYLGVYRDKLLSHPAILHDSDGIISNGIEKLWLNVCNNLCDESIRIYGTVDLMKMNIINMLAKKDKMSESVKSSIIETTKQYLTTCLEKRK